MIVYYNDKVVSWKNTLNYRHLPTSSWEGEFRDMALKLGYPYYSWNDVIMVTEPCERTGLFASDLGE